MNTYSLAMFRFAGNYVRIGDMVTHRAHILSVRPRTSFLGTPLIDVEIYNPARSPEFALNLKIISFIFNEARTKTTTISYESVEDRDADLKIIPCIWNE